MKRYEDEVQRNIRKLYAGAYACIDSGGTEDEVWEAVERGIREAREAEARVAGARV
jgi:hypothetical protein